jgi:type VI secretion system secreted protein Hcp
MAYDAFLKIDGIQGDSLDFFHKDEINITSFSWGSSRAGARGAGGGGGDGKVSFQDIHFSKFVDKSSPVLMRSCASGTHYKTALLTLRKAGGDPTAVETGVFYKIVLTDVLISSYQTGGGLQNDGTFSPLGDGADAPEDQFSLNFGTVNLTVVSQNPTGDLSVDQPTSGDLSIGN